MGKLKNGTGSMVAQTYRFPKDVYTMDEVHKWLKDNDITDYIKIEPAKEESVDDLEVFTEAIQLGPRTLRRETINGVRYIVTPVHLTQEGVANRILKEWGEIYDPEGIDGVDSFEGCLITRGHPAMGMGHDVPSLGKIKNVTIDPEKKRADAEAWLVEKRLTGKEIERLESNQPVSGSMAYNAKKILLPESEMWEDGSPYDAKVKGPLRANHYALLGENEIPACSVCGFNIPKEIAKEETTKLVLVDGEIRKCKAKKSKEVMSMETEELKSILNETITEAVSPLVARIEALEERKIEPPKLTEIDEFKALSESVKQLIEALPAIESFKADQDAAKLATQKAAFAKQLNAAHTENGRPEGEAFEAVWTEANKDPLGRDHWLGEHEEVRLKGTTEKAGFKGKPMDSGVEFDIDAENAKVFGYN